MRVGRRLVTGIAAAAGAAHLAALAEERVPGFAIAALLLSAGAASAGLTFAHATLRRRADDKIRSAENDALRAALDQVQYGVVMLDRLRRASFINRAYRRLWKLPDRIAETRPDFTRLMNHAGSVDCFPEQRGGMSKYIAACAAHVGDGSNAPLDIRHASGEVIRFQCAALPDGGRMLSYIPVTDLFRSADALRRLATIDGLTGINNRRHFTELADIEWSRFRRYQRPLSFVMFDIDHFKAVNDRFGHDAGDAVLAAFAQIARQMTRASDALGRLGGEEFAMLLPETDLPAALVVADRLRRRVEETPLAAGARTLRITVSAGAAQANLGMGEFAVLAKAADEALYAAKRGGRNRVVAAPAGDDGPRIAAA